MPKNKKEKPSVSPADLAERLSPLMAMRAKAGLRSRFGGVEAAKAVLEHLAELLEELDEAAPGVMADEMARAGTSSPETRKRSRPARPQVAPSPDPGAGDHP